MYLASMHLKTKVFRILEELRHMAVVTIIFCSCLFFQCNFVSFIVTCSATKQAAVLMPCDL